MWRKLTGQKKKHRHFVYALKTIVEHQTCLMVHLTEGTCPGSLILAFLWPWTAKPANPTHNWYYKWQRQTDSVSCPRFQHVLTLWSLYLPLLLDCWPWVLPLFQTHHHMQRQQLSTDISPLSLPLHNGEILWETCYSMTLMVASFPQLPQGPNDSVCVSLQLKTNWLKGDLRKLPLLKRRVGDTGDTGFHLLGECEWGKGWAPHRPPSLEDQVREGALWERREK